MHIEEEFKKDNTNLRYKYKQCYDPDNKEYLINDEIYQHNINQLNVLNKLALK
jgi:hypothetical protein